MNFVRTISAIFLVLASRYGVAEVQEAMITPQIFEQSLRETYLVRGQAYKVEDRLVDAEDFRAGLQLDKSMLIDLPSSNQEASPSFAASYLFLLDKPENAERFAFEFNQFTSNYKVLLVERESLRQTVVAELGRAHQDPDSSRVTSRRQVFPAFTDTAPVGTSYYLIIHRSTTASLQRMLPPNLNYLAIGDLQSMQNYMRWKLIEAATIVGMLLMLTISNFFLYLQRPEDSSSSFISLFSLIYAIRHMTTEGLWSELLIDPPNELMFFGIMVVYLATTLSMLCFAQFLRQTFRAHFSQKLLNILWLFNALASIFIGLQPFGKYWAILFFPILLATMAFIFWGLYKSIRAGERGSFQSSLGVALLLGGFFNDALVATGNLTAPYISYYTAVIFVFIQSSIVGQNFAIAFRTAERLTRQLSREVDRQTKNIKTILSHIHQGIFTVSGDQRLVGSDHSAHLDQILEQEGYEGKSIDQVFLQHINLSNDEKSRLRSAIDFSMDEDLLNFNCNRGSFIEDFEYTTKSGQKKLLKADWSPVVLDNEDRVEKILITLRDVTELKKLEAQAAEHQRMMMIISEIIEINPERFTNFIKICKTFLSENKRLIQQCQSIDLEVLKILFINMHTMKGAARTYHLKNLAAVMHDAEQYYATMQKNEIEWDATKLLEDLSKVEDAFVTYETVWSQKLGRDVSGKNVEINIDTLRKSISILQEFDEHFEFKPNLTPILDDLRATYFSLYYKNAQSVLEQIFEELPRLARDLQKHLPHVEYNLPELGFTIDGIEILQNIFIHLLRNTMDHGLEPEEERLAKGKNVQGVIRLHASIEASGQCLLVYQDDGRGLNIARIRDMGIERGLLVEHEDVPLNQIAECIFESGFSTSKAVSDISGRGVGMGAVKKFLEESGGSIHLKTSDELKDGFVSFQTEIRLASPYFHLFTHWEISRLRAVS